MKQLLLTTVFLLVLTSCSGRKQIEKAISHGNYEQAINDALQKLENNKDKPRKQDYIILLEDAYYKVMAEDLQRISRLKTENNPENYKVIYEMYLDLDARQQAIKRVLPLQIDGKNLSLKFEDYSAEIVSYQYKTSNYLLSVGETLLGSNNTMDARQAYEAFSYVEHITPNYKNTRDLLQRSRATGTDYVMVYIENLTNQILPERLEADILNFDTYGLDAFWTIYHGFEDPLVSYNYSIALQLKEIILSPEQIREKQELKKKTIVDGWEYKKDLRGNIMKDSLGNKIKIDKLIDIRAQYFEVTQFKSAEVIADVVFTNLNSSQVLDRFSLHSTFVFENFYAWIKGDQRTLTRHESQLTKSGALTFPSDAQMVFDTGEDLKLQFKDLLNAYTIQKS